MSCLPSEENPRIYEESKRVARLLDIIARISTRPKVWTRRALAQSFGISERRIQDDLDILTQRLSLPLAHCRSGYYLREARALPAVTFAFGEAVALLLTASVGRSMAGVDSAELAAGFTRLKEAFPVELRRLLEALEPRGSTEELDGRRRQVLEVLQEAVATRTTVRMRYATASRDDAESERLVDPYALIPYVRSFHLIAHCHTRGEVRIFKVDRIKELSLTAQRFAAPASFDVGEYLGESWGLMRGVGRAPELVRIRFTPRAGRRVSEERWHSTQQAEWQPDGSLIFAMRVGITPALVNWVLYYGSAAEVLEPAWLAEEVRREAAAVVGAYSRRGRSAGQREEAG